MNQLLQKYFQNNFFIIPIRKNDKRPLFKKWNQYQLSYNETKQYIKQGYNIGVVAKDLWILDYDERLLDAGPYYRMFNTLVQFSPHGYHLFLKCNDPFNERILKGFNHPDTVRHGDMYALLAPSKVDGKSYWWLDDMKGEILTL